MNFRFAKLGVFVFVAGLIFCSTSGWGADWKQFAEATTGIFRYDAASVSRPSQGLVRVWINNMTKNQTNQVELNCKDQMYHVLDVVQWDENYRVKRHEHFHDTPPDWKKISPRAVPEALSRVVCP
jgi:hypothetical protein